jgi:DNA (cytosine-5)-methyltransferase 1
VNVLSLFSGIEAASAAWLPIGWECVGFAEVEPFPCSVLAHRYPGVPNLGDIAKITREQIAALGPIDVVVGGFPCQDLSVAGKRKGLKNADGTITRSGLFFTACQIVEWANPRWTIIENVPGLFSSHGGHDFAAVVGELAGTEFDIPADGWRNTGVALGPKGLVEWTVLDAQWFGLAQRRKRVFFVRDSGDWANRPPLLFERDCLSGNPPPSREKREGVTGTLSARTEGGGGLGTDFELGGVCIPTPEVVGTLNATPTLRSMGHDGSHANAGGQVAVAFTQNQCGDVLTGDVSPSMGTNSNATGRNTPKVAIGITIHGTDKTASVASYSEIAGSLKARPPGGRENSTTTAIQQGMAVRRLTPKECARLQGFQDDYLDIIYRGKPAKDGPKYKALGNSFAVAVVRWIGERIKMVVTGG